MFGDGFTHVRPVWSNHWSRRQPSSLTTVRSAPILPLGVEQHRQLAERQAVPHRHRHVGDEAERARRRGIGPSICQPPIGLGRSRTTTSDVALRRLLQHVAQRRGVGVEARRRCPAGRRPACRCPASIAAVGRRRLAVERVDRQAGRLVLAVDGTSSSSTPRMPCSGLKSATSVTPGALCSRSMVGVPSRGAAGVVGEQADACGPAARANPSRGQHVDAGEHRRAAGCRRPRRIGDGAEVGAGRCAGSAGSASAGAAGSTAPTRRSWRRARAAA